MKKSIILIMLTGLILSALASSAQRYYLDEGEHVEIYPKVDWLKGESIKEFDKEKIYIVELWATWCKPCIAAIPHLNELNRKFKDKVIFIGQNVMEDDKAKVEDFVKKMGLAMDYRIAYGGPQGSDFDQKWVKASGTNMIPRTFIIQNNMLVWMTHPGALNAEILQLLIDKKFTKEAASKLQNKE